MSSTKLDHIGFEALLAEMLDRCSYPEDVEVLRHFTFHPRMNRSSNTCLVCFNAIEGDEGHTLDCAFLRALQRTAPRASELDKFVESA